MAASLKYKTMNCSKNRVGLYGILGMDQIANLPRVTLHLKLTMKTFDDKNTKLPILLFLSRFVHPRFGLIKCIRTIRAVEKDEELTVAYGYDHNPTGQNGPEAPEWYRVELKAFQASQKK